MRIERDGSGIFTGYEAPIDEAIKLAVKRRGERWPDLERMDGLYSPYRHPTPSEDCPNWLEIAERDSIEEAQRYFCGFESREQLLAWFDSEDLRSAMNEVGMEVIEFDIDAELVHPGHYQVMFLKAEAVEISRGPIPTLAH